MSREPVDLDDAQALLDRITRHEVSPLLRLALADEFAATFGQHLIDRARQAPNVCPACHAYGRTGTNPCPHPWHDTPKESA